MSSYSETSGLVNGDPVPSRRKVPILAIVMGILVVAGVVVLGVTYSTGTLLGGSHHPESPSSSPCPGKDAHKPCTTRPATTKPYTTQPPTTTPSPNTTSSPTPGQTTAAPTPSPSTTPPLTTFPVTTSPVTTSPPITCPGDTNLTSCQSCSCANTTAQLAAIALLITSSSTNTTVQQCTSLLGLTLEKPTCDIPFCLNATSAVIIWARYRPENYAVAGRDAYCDVRILVDNETNIQIDLPLPSKWNGILLSAGGGGFDGTLVDNYSSRNATTTPLFLNLGYIFTATDGGHNGTLYAGADWTFNHWQRVLNYFFRARHFTAVVAKQVLAAYYGQVQTLAIHAGCSNGGHAGITEATMFPYDYDAVLAGSPLWNYSTLLAYFDVEVRAFQPGGPTSLPLFEIDNFTTIRAAVVAKCDLTDGILDGWIADPRLCDFNPNSTSDLPGSWTTAQRDALSVHYTPKTFDGTTLPGVYKAYPGYEADFPIDSGITGWVPRYNASIPGDGQTISSQEDAYFTYGGFRAVYYPNISDAYIGNLMWNLTLTNAAWEQFFTYWNYGSVSPLGFGPFFAKGGKLIIWGGYQDPAIPATLHITNYNLMASASGGLSTLLNSARLFLLPEEEHCSGEIITDNVGSIVAWARTGIPPLQWNTTHKSNTTKQRIVCAEPYRPTLQNASFPDLWSSWNCTVNGTLPAYVSL
jgi:hypothetical protein